MMKAGYTFIKEDIQQHQRQEKQQRHTAFLQRARQHWQSNN